MYINSKSLLLPSDRSSIGFWKSLPEQSHHGASGSPESLAFIPYTLCVLLLISVGGRYFLFLILDKAVCPFLVKYFEMPIWHPTCEKSLDELLNATVDL